VLYGNSELGKGESDAPLPGDEYVNAFSSAMMVVLKGALMSQHIHGINVYIDVS